MHSLVVLANPKVGKTLVLFYLWRYWNKDFVKLQIRRRPLEKFPHIVSAPRTAPPKFPRKKSLQLFKSHAKIIMGSNRIIIPSCYPYVFDCRYLLTFLFCYTYWENEQKEILTSQGLLLSRILRFAYIKFLVNVAYK